MLLLHLERDEDLTPLSTRPLDLESSLERLLSGLPRGADSLRLLGEILSEGREEVRSLLVRQKITLALYEHAQGSFVDP